MSTTSPSLNQSKPDQNRADQHKKFTTLSMLKKKQRGQIISMLTAYDYPTALIADQAGIEVVVSW